MNLDPREQCHLWYPRHQQSAADNTTTASEQKRDSALSTFRRRGREAHKGAWECSTTQLQSCDKEDSFTVSTGQDQCAVLVSIATARAKVCSHWSLFLFPFLFSARLKYGIVTQNLFWHQGCTDTDKWVHENYTCKCTCLLPSDHICIWATIAGNKGRIGPYHTSWLLVEVYRGYAHGHSCCSFNNASNIHTRSVWQCW